jgi:hypothetical protein
VKRKAPVDLALSGVMALAAAIFVLRLLDRDLSLFRTLDDTFLLRSASVLKLAFLLLGTWLAIRNAARFGADNPIRPAWLLLGLGLAATLLGQAVLACYQLSPAAKTPFPSAADGFFLLGYPFLVAALVFFGRAYERAGYDLGSSASRWMAGLLVSAVGLVVAAVVLRPILTRPAPPVEMFLNVAYPVLDLVLLVPTVLLFRASLPLRGGGVWKAWAALLVGFFFMSVGDVLFAYFQALGATVIDPLVHVTYLLSYGFLALGVTRQSRLLAS